MLVFLRIYSRVVFQDDCIKGWGNVFGKQVHSSGTGRLKSKLRNSFKTLIVILGFEPTSQECFVCSNLCKLSLLDRIIKCECGRQCYQDTNSALVALRKGLGLSFEQPVGLDWSELTTLKKEASAHILESNSYIHVSYLL